MNAKHKINIIFKSASRKNFCAKCQRRDGGAVPSDAGRAAAVGHRVGGFIVRVPDLGSQFRGEQAGPVTGLTVGESGPVQPAPPDPRFFPLSGRRQDKAAFIPVPGPCVRAVLTLDVTNPHAAQREGRSVILSSLLQDNVRSERQRTEVVPALPPPAVVPPASGPGCDPDR